MDKLNADKLIDSEVSRSSDITSGRSGLELSIVIVDYKSTNYTLRLIADLQKKLAGQFYEIIVVDNDPTGDADKKIEGHFADKSIKIIKAKKNAGFGAGNNLGAKVAGGEYLLLLNPDTEVRDDAIHKMLDFISKHAEIGALTPLIYQPDSKTLQRNFFGNFQSFAGITIKRWWDLSADLSKDFFYADMVTGAAMMLRRELFEKIGGFDENFFMYIEDDDLCRKISNLGLKNAVLTTAEIIHFEGQSSTLFEKKKFYYKSQDYYWQKHYGTFQTTLMRILRSPYILWQKLKNKS